MAVNARDMTRTRLLADGFARMRRARRVDLPVPMALRCKKPRRAIEPIVRSSAQSRVVEVANERLTLGIEGRSGFDHLVAARRHDVDPH